MSSTADMTAPVPKVCYREGGGEGGSELGERALRHGLQRQRHSATAAAAWAAARESGASCGTKKCQLTINCATAPCITGGEEAGAGKW